MLTPPFTALCLTRSSTSSTSTCLTTSLQKLIKTFKSKITAMDYGPVPGSIGVHNNVYQGEWEDMCPDRQAVSLLRNNDQTCV